MPMHKRILCVLLAALVLLSLIPALALPSQAASNMKLSETCVEILKRMEGFIEYPMWDNGHYSVGYGSSCERDDYPDGITEEEADALMREFLADMEEALNNFANRQGIVFSQNQFDALMLFTYNCGTGWIYGDGEFRQAVLDDTNGNAFIFYMTQWSSASAQLHMGLVNRRLIEADMYLNGSYTNTKPSNYTYVLYDNNGGQGNSKVQGYDCNLPACVMSTPAREGYRFLGWYTTASGGNWITELTSQNAEQTIYAHWQAEGVTANTAPAASYKLPSDKLVSREFYNTPNGSVVGSLSENAFAEIKADFVDSNGVKWGKLPNGGWVKLGDPRIGTFKEEDTQVGVKVTVTGDYVNVRIGPGTQYTVTAAVLQGDEIVITRVVDVDGTLWGKFRGGWVCLQYTDYAGGLTPGQPGQDIPVYTPGTGTVIATGTVTADVLNIRAAAGPQGYLLGCYEYGDRVQILEKTVVSGTHWGRTDRGWICLTYVRLDDGTQTPETSEPAEPETTEPETTIPETTVPETEPEKPESEITGGIPATVISKTGLNVRSGAGTEYASVGSYASGEKIVILEQKTVSGVAWGRTDKGWVCMQYVKLDDVWTTENGVYGVVTSTAGLLIRSGAGVGNAPVGSYTAGERIIILEQTIVAGQKWGRTEKGWVSMTYVRLEQSVTDPATSEPSEPETTEPETTDPEVTEPSVPEQEPDTVTGVVSANVLNIRSTPGTGGGILGGYNRGDRVTILEQTLVNGTPWGRTDKGWICLAYVKLDASESEVEAGQKGEITADILCIRKGPGTGNAIVGTYFRGEVVTILETTKVGGTTWGRTDKGWICMDYVK